jgi:hypothetical protein
MGPLSAERLLEAWERGVGLEAPGRARAILAASDPARTEEELGATTAGRRDSDLLAVRAATFGPHIDALAPCPACGQLAEFGFSVQEVVSADAAESGGEPLRVLENGFDVRFRLPTVDDLAHLSSDVIAAGNGRTALLDRCVVQARHRGKAVPVEDLTEEVAQAIDAEMARADPNADIAFALDCEACGTAWSASFDVPAFVWTEVDARARRLLLEIHSLAAAYGWTEREILALSPVRRLAYLELAASMEPVP